MRGIEQIQEEGQVAIRLQEIRDREEAERKRVAELETTNTRLRDERDKALRAMLDSHQEAAELAWDLNHEAQDIDTPARPAPDGLICGCDLCKWASALLVPASGNAAIRRPDRDPLDESHMDYRPGEREALRAGTYRPPGSDNPTAFRNLETRLCELRAGALFRTADGILAVKSEYSLPNGQSQCVLLESGEYAHFENGDATFVTELRAGEPDAG